MTSNSAVFLPAMSGVPFFPRQTVHQVLRTSKGVEAVSFSILRRCHEVLGEGLEHEDKNSTWKMMMHGDFLDFMA